MDETNPGRNARQRPIGRPIIRRVKSLPNVCIFKTNSSIRATKNGSPSTSNYPEETAIGSKHTDVTDEKQVVDHTSVGPFDSSSSSPNTAETPFDVNVYQQKKTLAQGMMDLALISANANQMRYVLQFKDENFYTIAISMIAMSLVLQVIVGVGLIWNSKYNVKERKHTRQANRTNNWTVIGIFLVTILNVFISSFGVSSTITTETQNHTILKGDCDMHKVTSAIKT